MGPPSDGIRLMVVMARAWGCERTQHCMGAAKAGRLRPVAAVGAVAEGGHGHGLPGGRHSRVRMALSEMAQHGPHPAVLRVLDAEHGAGGHCERQKVDGEGGQGIGGLDLDLLEGSEIGQPQGMAIVTERPGLRRPLGYEMLGERTLPGAGAAWQGDMDDLRAQAGQNCEEAVLLLLRGQV